MDEIEYGDIVVTDIGDEIPTADTDEEVEEIPTDDTPVDTSDACDGQTDQDAEQGADTTVELGEVEEADDTDDELPTSETDEEVEEFDEEVLEEGDGSEAVPGEVLNENTSVLPCICSVKAGDTVMIVMRDGEPTVIGAAGNGDEMNAGISAASKAASDAQTAADSAQSSADAAQSAADTAKATANAAQASANEAANAAANAQTSADNAAKEAQEANEKADSAATDAAKANTDLAGVKEEVTGIKADAVTLRSDLEGQIESVTTTMQTDYAKKTDISDTEATLRTEISTSAAGITQTVSENYAKKTDVEGAITTAKADLQTQITQNADKISLTAKSVEQAQVDIKANATNITEAKNAAATAQSTANAAKTDAQEASTAAANAQSAADAANTAASNAQTKANEAATAAATAQTAADKAKTDLATAQQKLAEVEANANATAEDLETAQQAVATAQAAADAAQSAADTAKANAAAAQSTADTAKANAATAQSTANTAKTNAANAQKAADAAQASADAANNALAVLEPRVTAAETAIEQNAEAITLRATKTEVTTAKNDAISAAATDATSKANAAKEDAISEAATDATSKANAALADAKSYADAQIKVSADSITSTVSKTYQVKGDYATKTQAQGYANTAKTEAVSAAAADATSKANAAQANAISTAAEDATTKADAAEAAAKQDTANKLKDYSTTVQMNSAIQQKADSITSTVAETYQPKGDYVTGTSAYSQLKQTVSGLNSTVQSHTGSISNLQQTAEGIQVRLENQQTVKNMVSKSRLLDGWGHVVSAGVTVSKNVSTSAPEFGEVTVAQFKAATANSSAQSSYIHMTNAARVTSGSKYTLSMWARKVSGGNARPRLSLSTTNQSTIIAENLTTEWKRYSYTFALGTISGSSKYVDITTSFGISVLAGQTGVFEVCCPQLEAGDTMNPWSANSVDATDYMGFTEGGVVVGDMTEGTLEGNIKIDSDSVDIRNGEDAVASFASYQEGWLYNNEMPYSELTGIASNLLVQSEGEVAILHSYPNATRNNLDSNVWLGDAAIILRTEDSALASDSATEIVLEGNGVNKVTIRAEDGNNGYGTIDMIGNVVINPNGSSFKPYYVSGTTAVTRLFTAGYVTNSKTQVVFTIPIERYCTYRTVSITSDSGGAFKLRQNGAYTHGSSSSELVNPSSYTATHRGKYITVVATFSTTTNAVNNAPVGIEFSGTLTFS